MALTNGAGLRILWATDGSETSRSAVPLLRNLILPSTLRLSVLSVAPHSLISGARPDPGFLTRSTPAARRRGLLEAEHVAQRAISELDPSSLEVEAISRWGNPIQEILRAARADGSDLIVLGAKGHSDLRLVLLGSVSQGVVHNATRPVLIARPAADTPSQVVVGFDGSNPARRAVEFLERLNLSASVLVRLVFVIEPFLLPDRMPSAYRRQAAANAQHIDERRLHEARFALDATASVLRAAGRRVETEVLTGPSAPILDAAAVRHGAGLIVVGSRRPSPARHYLLGSTAEKLVRHSRASVLVVR